MSESTRQLSYALEHQFPHPIAAAYRCAQTARGSAERAAYYLATMDGFLRYAGTILVSDFFSKSPSPEKAAGITDVLLYPTLVKWADLIGELSVQLNGRSPFMPELVSAMVYKNGKPTQTGASLKKLAQSCWDLLEDKSPLVDEEKAGAMVAALGDELEQLLSKFMFLEKYPLVVFKRHQAGDGDGFRGFMVRWMGYRTTPLPIGVEFDGVVPEGRLLVASPDLNRSLDLSPFAEISQPSNRQSEALFLVSGMRSETVMKLQNLCTACFATRELSVNDEPATLSDYMASWSGGGVAVLNPSKSSANRLKFKSKLLPTEQVLEGRYKALGFIGRGGIGAVYRVHDLEEEVDKAVKILYPDLSRNEFFTRYFLETGSLLAELEHANLVPVYKAGYSSTLQENHIVMAYMPGGSLAELLERRELLPPGQSIGIATAVLGALAKLHESELVHGGIHPGNILFDGAARPCLADFGILRLPSSRVTTFRPLERLHSLRYASPELLLGGQASSGSDVYSIGQVLYEMLTGRVPSKTEFVPPSELIFPVPELLDNVLKTALAPVPENRYASAVEFGEALRLVEEGMGEEFHVSITASAQQLAGHLSDVQSGHNELLDLERHEKVESGDFEAAARLLQLKIDDLWDIDERVYWLQQLAALYFEQLDMPGKAVSIYRDCLELAPDNPVAIGALIGHFEMTEQWPELAELLDDLREQAEGDEAEVKFLRKLVEIHHEKLGDGAAAGAFLEALVEKAGAEEESIELLVRLKEEAQDWPGAARALEKWLESATDAEQSGSLLRRLAAIYHEELQQHEAATSTYQRLLELQPGDRKAMDGLRALYRLAFAYAALADMLRTMLASGKYDDGEKVELYQELGEILSSYMYESKSALAVWNELLELDSENQTALSYLERLYLREARNEEYLEILERKARVVEEPGEKSAILLSAALAKLEFMSDVDGARSLLEEGLELTPAHAGIEAALERLYEEHGDTDAQGRLLLSKLDREEAPAARLEILWKLANLFEKGADAPAAIEVMKRAFREAPKDPSVRTELERLVEFTDSYEELVTFYMEELAGADADLGDYVAGRVAHICLQNIEDREKSLFALEKAAELKPDNSLVQKSLLSAYREAEKWDKLAELMISYMSKVEDSRRAELFEEVALLIKNRLGSSQWGRQLLLDLIQMAPQIEGIGALATLKDACVELEQFQAAADVVERQLKLEADPVRAQSLRMEMGELYGRLENPAQARVWLESALEKAPSDERVHRALEEALAAAEDWKGLVALYRRLLPLTVSQEAKESFMMKAAQIEMNVFDNAEAAIELYRQLLSTAPNNTDYAIAMAEVLKKAERYAELTWHYEQLAKKLKGEEKIRVLRELADVYYDKLENTDAAVQALRQVVKLEPDDPDAFFRARDICQEEKRFETLLKLLGARSKQVEADEKVTLLVQMARISALEMGLIPPALKYLDESLSVQPSNADAFDLYRELLERKDDWKKLAKLMEKHVGALADEARKAELGVALAELYGERLDQRVKASEILEKVWETDPDNTEAALQLAINYAMMSRWDKAASMLAVLQSQDDRMSDGQRGRFVFLSGLTFEALLQRSKAIDAFRHAVVLGHRTDEAEEKLAALLYMEEEFEEARELIARLQESGRLSMERAREFQNLLADIDRKLGRREKSREHLGALLKDSPGDKAVLLKMVEVCREEADLEGEVEFAQRLLDIETDPEKRFPLLVGLGDAARQLEGREEEAVEAYVKAFDINANSRGVLFNLGELQMKMGLFDDAVASFGEAENLEQDKTRQAALALTQGVLFVEHAGEPEKAIPHLKRCLDLDPSKWEAFSILEELAVQANDWQGQKELYETVLERLSGNAAPDLNFKLNLNLGRILLEKFGDSTGALRHFEVASALRPNDAELAQLTAGIHLQSGDGLDQALASYRKLVEASPRDANLLHMLRKTYAKMKRYDEAWYVAGALQMLGAASQKEKAFYQKFSSSALKIKPKVVTIEMLRQDLLAPEEDFELSEIIRLVFERMSSKLQLPTSKSLGHTRKTAFDPNQSKLFGQMLAIVAKVLGIQAPGVYVREASAWIHKEGCYPPVLAVGSDVLKSLKGKELRFELARNLALFVPHHVAVGVLDLDATRLLLGNMLKLLITKLPEPKGDHKANMELRKEMEKRIPAAELGQVRQLVTDLRQRGGEMSVKRWLVGVEKTACRFGLLFANDVELAAEQVRKCPSHVSVASREELVDDLLIYAVSDKFHRLRRHLGISVI